MAAACVVIAAASVFVVIRAQRGFDIAKGNTRILEAEERAAARRDCVTTLSAARRSVFDDVDIYKAIQIDQLATALLNAQSGARATPEQVQAFSDNAANLDKALVEARRLQPAKTLDELIAHGGMIAGVHYDPCPS